MPPGRPKYTPRDWELNNRTKNVFSLNQQTLAERIIWWVVVPRSFQNPRKTFFSSESERLIDETNFTTELNKHEVDFRLRERIGDIRFRLDELKKQKKDAHVEEEALKVYKQRTIDAINTLREIAMPLCQKCMIFREMRQGVDLVQDEVDNELRRELHVVNGAIELLQKLMEEGGEQLRRLRATIYLLDRDLSNKEKSIQIDEKNVEIRHNQMGMKVYDGNVPLDP